MVENSLTSMLVDVFGERLYIGKHNTLSVKVQPACSAIDKLDRNPWYP
jgi:hypothetical protein